MRWWCDPKALDAVEQQQQQAHDFGSAESSLSTLLEPWPLLPSGEGEGESEGEGDAIDGEGPFLLSGDCSVVLVLMAEVELAPLFVRGAAGALALRSPSA